MKGTVTANACGKKACTRKALPGVTIQAAGPVTETATTGKDGTFELFLAPGTYTVTPTLKGYAFAPAKRPVDLTKEVSGVDFKTCASGTSARRTSSASVNGPFCRELFVTNTTDAKTLEFPIHIEYKGVGWDPGGGPITIKWEGKPIKKFPQAESFSGKIVGTAWPRRGRLNGSYRCYGELAAAQSGLERPVPLKSVPTGVVIFADLDPRWRANQIYCGEEKTILPKTPGTIIGVNERGLLSIFQRGSVVPDVSIKGKLCVDLTGNRGHVEVSRVSGRFRVERGAGSCK
jgi:hypothetical protein